MAKQRLQFKHGTFASFPQTNDTEMSVQVNGAFGLKFILIVVAVFNVFVFVKYITIGSSIEIHQNSINYPTPRHLFDVKFLEAFKIRINKQKNSTGVNHDYFGLEITENITVAEICIFQEIWFYIFNRFIMKLGHTSESDQPTM